MGHPSTEFVHPAEQSGSGGGAGWTDIKIIKAHTFLPQFVGMGSLEVWVTMSIDIPISLIICEDEYDIGSFGDSYEREKKEECENGLMHRDLINLFPCTQINQINRN